MSRSRGIRIGLFCGLAMALASAAGAQCLMSLGPQGGLIWSKTNFDSNDPDLGFDHGRNSGFALGLAVDGQCSEHFGIQFEALYTRRNTKFTFTGGGLPPIHSTYRVYWIDFPLTAHILFAEDESAVRPYIFAGPMFSARIRAKSDNSSAGESSETDVKSQVKSTMVSVVGGLGLRFRMSKKAWFTLDGRYIYGLNDISRGSGQDWKVRDIEALAGFLFAIN